MAEDDLNSKVWNHSGDSDAAKNAWASNGNSSNPNFWHDVFASSGDGNGDNPTPPADLTPPDLKTVDSNWPLPATGDLGTESNYDSSSEAAPEVPDFSVDVGTLDDAQNALLPKANTAVDTYTALKTSTVEKAPWIFQQQHAGDLGTEQQQVGGSAAGGSGPTYTDVKVEANQHLVEQTPKLKAVLDNMLLGIADSVRLAGDFTSYINTAAQTYVYADKQAFINPSGTPETK
jgi:hypothetical protein